ncbi:MAG TPA: ricin-type beta-trefoil lectin domain protein [Streptosporangiaceae bacterium]
MPAAMGRFRRYWIAAASLLLCSGLTVSAATTASAATGTRAGVGRTASTGIPTAHAAAAASPFTITNPGMVHTKPDTAITFGIRYTDTDSSATETFSAAGLPPGLSIAPDTAVISGTTNSAIASYNVTVSGTDSDGNTASVQFTWNIWNGIQVGPVPSYEQSTVGTPVSVQLHATDTAPGSTFTYGASNLPVGLTLDSSTGIISGTPAALSGNMVTVTATDQTGSVGTGEFTWDVGGSITVSGLPLTTSQVLDVGEAEETPFTVHDNAAGDTLTYKAQGLPPGLRLDPANGFIYGWLTAQGNYQAVITVSGLYGGSGSSGAWFTVQGPIRDGLPGPVHLNLGDKCLDDTGDSSANGTKIQIWACNGGAAQNWVYLSDSSLEMNGKCLDVVNRSTAANAKLQLWSCTGAGNQQWDVGTGAQLRGLASGYCLTDPASSTKNGTQVEITGCGGYSLREWTLPAGPVLSAIPGRCLDDRASTANGAQVDASTCTRENPQNWTFEPDGTIRAGGKCLDDTGDSTASGAKIQIWTCNGDAAQQWTVTGANDSFGVELEHGSLCVTPTSMTATNGARLVLGTCGTDESYWHGL